MLLTIEGIRTQGYKKNFMLDLTELEIHHAHHC